MMEFKKPIALTLASAFAANCISAGYGVQLFTDLPPMSAIAVGSVSTGTMYMPMYSTVTDEPIEAPVPEKVKVTQS
jgi:hypothetical protein